MNKKLLAAGLALALWAALLCFLGASAEARWPAAPGRNLKKNGKLQVDAEHLSEGYFSASLQKKNNHRMKLRVIKGKTTLTYDLNSDGEFEVFPLQLGDGKYEIVLYENVKGKSYSNAGKITVNVKLSSPDACYYYPNQYVSYTDRSEAYRKADELCRGKGQGEAYDIVCSFMKKTFHYDFVKAINIKAGTLPDIDGAYKKKMGICQDLAAIMCCMLRTQGLPARLVIGYADSSYHAWVEITFGGKDYFFDPTAAVNGIRSVKTYTVERFY